VPGEFELCWNCGSDLSVLAELGGNKDVRASDITNASESPAANPASIGRATHCAACGSTKIVPNLLVNDQGQYSSGQLQVVFYTNPDAIFFKGGVYGELTANICGDCGHVQLHVANPSELYEYYLKSKQ
jgi:hypothetical protein